MPVRLVQSLTAGAPIRCFPDYFPASNAGSMEDHSKAADCFFYAVLSGGPRGIYTDFYSQIKPFRLEYPGMVVISDPDWLGIHNKWDQNCDDNHDHFEEWRSEIRSGSTCSSSLSTASAPDRSPCPSAPPSCPPSPPLFNQRSQSQVQTPATKAPLRSPRKPPSTPPLLSSSSHERSPTKSPAKLSASSPQKKPPSSISSLSSMTSAGSSIASQFLPPAFTAEPFLLPRLLPEMGIFSADSRPRRQGVAHSILTEVVVSAPSSLSQAPTPVTPLRGTDALKAAVPSLPAVYAVSVRNELFKNRARAHEVFEKTDGAELLLVRSVDQVSKFFQDVQSMGPSLQSRTIYAVSGHHIAFKNREKAYRLFLENDGAEMLFARSSEEAEVYIRKHLV
ncbi:hypothetical protein C8R43DRAFT_1045612 [Mycena crocata]|nr:hypothetical protein C8R43DRAFT_1045612 [Mycena crocata]